MTSIQCPDKLASELHRALLSKGEVLVLAESCTAGLIASTIARIPGALNLLAGSAVVYQVPTKEAWLGVSPQTVADEGVVSGAVAAEMALGVLRLTPHATSALAITGHLGPGAPHDEDGIAWMAAAFEQGQRVAIQKVHLDEVAAADPNSDQESTLRIRRQQSAVAAALQFFLQQVSATQPPNPDPRQG